jgi:hypothetical protein
MKINIYSFLFVMTLFITTAASAQDIPNSRDFPVRDFDKLYIEGGYKVILYQTSDPFLKVKAPADNYIDELEVQTDAESLRLSVKRSYLNLNRMELHIGFSTLKELHVEGGISLSTDGFVSVDDLRLHVEGGAKGDLKLKARTLEVTSNGGVVFDLSGVADRLSVKVAGAGHVNARELTAREVYFRVEGLGFGSVHATDVLDAQIEGMGKITYVGNPETRRIVNGLGSVVPYE